MSFLEVLLDSNAFLPLCAVLVGLLGIIASQTEIYWLKQLCWVLFVVGVIVLVLYSYSKTGSVTSTPSGNGQHTAGPKSTIMETPTSKKDLPLYLEKNVFHIEKNENYWGILYFNESEKSNTNESMPGSIVWYNNYDDLTATNTAKYYLDQNYDVVTGTLFLPLESRDTKHTGYIEAYGDGRCLYVSPQITGGFLPESIKFDVTGVTILELVFHAEGATFFGISNLYAK